MTNIWWLVLRSTDNVGENRFSVMVWDINSLLANGDKSPSDKICQMHTQSSEQTCPT